MEIDDVTGAGYGFTAVGATEAELMEYVAKGLVEMLEANPGTDPLVLGSARSVLKAVSRG